MKIDKSCKVELCASNDITRQSLRHAYYEPERKRLMATDGHCAVIVPVFPEEGDHAGPISADALKAARKAAGKGATLATIAANGAQVIPNGPTFPRPDGNYQFPPMDAVVPDHRPLSKGSVTIAVNVDLLTTVAAAMGTSHVTLTFTRPDNAGVMLAPIVVLANERGTGGPMGLVMPMAPWYRGDRPAPDAPDAWDDGPTSPDVGKS